MQPQQGGLCRGRGLLALMCVCAAVGVSLYTYRYTVYWDRTAGTANWLKFNTRECAFDGGFQRCYEPVWLPLTLNLLPLALAAQIIAAAATRAYKPTGRPAESFLPPHEYDAVELRHRHEPRVLFLKLLFLAFLATHLYTFQNRPHLYGPTKGNARTKLTHTLTWLVAVPFATLPALLFGWVLDGWLATARGRMLKTLSAVIMLAAAVTELGLVFTAFGTLTTAVADVSEFGVQGFLDTPFRSIVLLVFVVRLPGLVGDVLGVSLRNCFSSCALDKYTMFDDDTVVVVRPGAIGLHIAVPAPGEEGGADSVSTGGLLVTEAETLAMRPLEQRRILRVQTVHDKEPVAATVAQLNTWRSYSRVLFFDDNASKNDATAAGSNAGTEDGSSNKKDR